MEDAIATAAATAVGTAITATAEVASHAAAEVTAHGNAALTIALAMAIGLVAQSAAFHLRVPGIVILLAAGVLLGPDLVGMIDPSSLGAALPGIIGFAVAVILFEGGMNLNLSRLKTEGRAIRQLISVGAVVTVIGASLAARILLDWEWRTAILFGTLVIVTGPTVITPLLRRFKIEHATSTVLEAEGVLIDAIGAVVAVVTLEVALEPSGKSMAIGVFHIGAKLAVGSGIGFVGGFVLAWLLRFRNVIPKGLETVFTLSVVLALYQGSDAIMHESGIAAAMVAGMVVGNSQIHVQRELLEFKEQLTVMLIGMLFVLLAAAVRMSDVAALGTGGLVVVATLVFVVRPLNVLAGTWGTSLKWKQKAFIAWMGPRGIVAAAVASFFAAEMALQGIPGGQQLQAMVFMVIALTVTLAGLSGGLLARLLGLSRPNDDGWVILSANALSRALARSLQGSGETVVMVDANPESCQIARGEGFKVVCGNGLEEATLHDAGIDTRRGAIGMCPNDEINLLFAQKAREEGKVRQLVVSLHDRQAGATPGMIRKLGGELLFGKPVFVDLWAVRLRRGLATVQRWRLPERLHDDLEERMAAKPTDGLFVVLAVHRAKSHSPYHDGVEIKPGNEVSLVIQLEREELAAEQLRALGWVRVDAPAGDAPTSESKRASAPEPAQVA